MNGIIIGDRNIKEMKVECDNANNGCEWIGELCSLDKHFIICDYTFLSCPNECEDGDKILRKDMEKHKAEECQRYEYICPHCDESGEYICREDNNTLKNAHLWKYSAQNLMMNALSSLLDVIWMHIL